MSNPAEQLREGIHSYFREFGYNSCELIFNEIVRHGGMEPLLNDLGLNDPGNSDDQYVYLLNYLRRNGIDVFAKKMGAEAHRNAERPLIPEVEGKPVSGLPYMKQPTPLGARQYKRVQAKLPERKSSESVALPDPSEVEPVIRKKDTPLPEADDSSSGLLPDGSWDGKTERRSGKERRARGDRRSDVDVVFKNRRYGGDRRSGAERRKNWPPKEWPLPRDEDGKIIND